MNELAVFTLGFLCSSAIFIGIKVWSKTTPTVIVQRTVESPDGKRETVTEPVVTSSVRRLDRPNNEKARKFATGSYQREMEEAVTRGEGYPL